MEGDGRSGLRCILAPEQAEHLALKEYATIKLMQVIAERDAALVERDNALAEKKHALSERDAAFAQRDMAVAERDAAMMERDNAIAALDSARGHRSLSWNPYRRPELKGREAPVMQITLPNMNVMNFGMEDMHAFSAESPMLGFASSSDKVQPVQPSNGRKRKKEGSKVNKGKKMSGGVPDMLKLDGRHRHGEVQPNGSRLHELHEGMTTLLPSSNPFGLQAADQQPLENQSASDSKELDMIVSTPIPYCSCTGTNQPCYRWGNGGWQSACCTTTMSMHPLPMNPKKKGYRLPGRKMSAGAFQKLVARLSQEGVDLSIPIDLKNYWSKHGTNRYVTIK